MKHTTKRFLSIIMALVMIMSLLPVMASAATITGGTVLYLTPNANWKIDNARFAAYFFGNGEAWASATAVEGETDLYQVTVPSGNWTNVIFCRMNPGTTANNWNNKWNQTSDLTYDGTNNHYTVKSGTWDKGGGTWSLYEVPVEPETTVPTTESETPPDVFAPRSVTVHYRNIHLWDTINAHRWIPEGKDLTTWPGEAVSANESAINWYTLTLSLIDSDTVGIIFNNGNGAQTIDFIIDEIPESGAEYWIDETVKTEDSAVQIQTSAPADTWPDGSIKADPTITPVYLKPNANWSAANARFALHCFNENGSAAWFDLVDSDADGIYEGVVPEVYSTIIFCRMNPATTENNWDNKWNQTADLSVPTDDKNCYIITEGSWDAGAWSVIPPQVISPVIGDGCVTIHYFDDTADYVEVRGSMNNWNDGYAMTKNEQGIWSVTINIVGTYQYKLVIGDQWILDPENPEIVTEENGNQNSQFTVTSGNVAQVGETVYTSVAEAVANANGEAVKLLLTNQESINITADLTLDLNGCTMGMVNVAENCTLTLIDSATDDYEGPCGYVQVNGTVESLGNYLLISDEHSVYSAHRYDVEITHISLKPANDALGFKATVKGDSYVQSAVTGFGFDMSAAGGKAVTFQKDKAPTNGQFSLRLQGILAANGGEITVTGKPFVIFGENTAYGAEQQTSMQEAIQEVDAAWDTYEQPQKDAVIALLAGYPDLIGKWNLSNISVAG